MAVCELLMRTQKTYSLWTRLYLYYVCGSRVYAHTITKLARSLVSVADTISILLNITLDYLIISPSLSIQPHS